MLQRLWKFARTKRQFSRYVFLKHEANICYVALKNKTTIDYVALKHEVNIEVSTYFLLKIFMTIFCKYNYNLLSDYNLSLFAVYAPTFAVVRSSWTKEDNSW